MKTIGVIVSCALLSCALVAQNTSVHKYRISELVGLSEPTASMTLGPSRCDGAGVMYIRPYETPTGSAAVSRITKTGRVLPSIRPSAETLSNSTLADFTIDNEGNTYLLLNGRVEPQVSILTFNSSGVQTKAVALSAPSDVRNFNAQKIERFTSGRFLVLGTQSAALSSLSAFTGIFESDGKFVTKALEDKLFAGAPSADDLAGIGLLLTQPVDTNIRVLTWTSPLRLIEVSDTGATLKQMPVQLPKPGLRPVSFMARGHRAVVLFSGSEPNSDHYAINELTSGATLDAFPQTSLEGHGSLSCYDGDRISLVSGSALMHHNLKQR
jgi:hypothetical protein